MTFGPKGKHLPPQYTKRRMVRLTEQTDKDLVTLARLSEIPPAVLARGLIETGLRLVQESASKATFNKLPRAQRRILLREDFKQK